MPPDEQGSPPSPESDAAPQAAAPATTATAPATDDLGSLAEAFRDHPEALKGRPAGDREPEGEPDRRSQDQAPPGASAPRPGASKPGEQTQPDLSRRGAAAKISDQQSEIDRLVTEREAERARASEHEAQVRAHEERRTQAQQAALARIGDDQEFARLSDARMRGSPMSYADDEKLNEMLSAREWAADLWEMTDRAHKTLLAKSLGAVVEKHGLDKTVAYEAPLPELVEHAVAVTEARVRKETADEIAELKAQNRGLRTKTAHAATPTVGGASAPGGAGMPADGASAEEWFRYGISQRQQAARPNGGASLRDGSAAMRR